MLCVVCVCVLPQVLVNTARTVATAFRDSLDMANEAVVNNTEALMNRCVCVCVCVCVCDALACVARALRVLYTCTHAHTHTQHGRHMVAMHGAVPMQA